MAFDGSYYYFTAKYKEKILRLDRNLKGKKLISTRKIFTALCYDTKENCFWAAARNCSEIFKLSPGFQELDCLKLGLLPGMISGISYACGEDVLLVTTGERVLRVTKCSPPVVTELKSCPGMLMTGITAVSPCYLYHAMQSRQRLCLMSDCGNLLLEAYAPKDFFLDCMIYGGTCDGYAYFQALATHHDGCQYLLGTRIERAILGAIDPCNEDLFAEGILPDCRPPKPCPTPDCDDCCPEYPPCCGCNQVLESVALVETALAHILNAEGEKLQKAIACATNVGELLAVNRSVATTITHVTHLEQTLYAKLDALRSCSAAPCEPCEPCNPCNPCNPCDPCQSCNFCGAIDW
ncbi:MAG: hypothetical protein RRY65_03710, partial [Pseudoflavonifractor sp.]